MKDYIKNEKSVRQQNQSSSQPIASEVHQKQESDLYSKVVKKAI